VVDAGVRTRCGVAGCRTDSASRRSDGTV